MKALTLYQPWASLVAVGAKTIETRSWGAGYRGELAIHASKKFPKEHRGFCLCAVCRIFMDKHERLKALSEHIPLGEVVALAVLKDCCPTIEIVSDLGEEERALGDYSPGRWAWILGAVQPLRAPYVMQGALGLWRVSERDRDALRATAAEYREAAGSVAP